MPKVQFFYHTYSSNILQEDKNELSPESGDYSGVSTVKLLEKVPHLFLNLRIFSRILRICWQSCQLAGESSYAIIASIVKPTFASAFFCWIILQCGHFIGSSTTLVLGLEN
jgi:hypothetical protein